MSKEAVFEDRVGKFMQIGSLRGLRYAYEVETEEYGKTRFPVTLSTVCKIIADWLALEAEHGDCAMLDADNDVVKFAESALGSRLHHDRSLVENARRLRAVKGPGWWAEKHSFVSYS